MNSLVFTMKVVSAELRRNGFGGGRLKRRLWSEQDSWTFYRTLPQIFRSIDSNILILFPVVVAFCAVILSVCSSCRIRHLG